MLFRSYHDWRIPNIAELRTIVDCTKPNCLDPIFGATQASYYWSSTTVAFNPGLAWSVVFITDFVSADDKNGFANFARAVRGGR